MRYTGSVSVQGALLTFVITTFVPSAHAQVWPGDECPATCDTSVCPAGTTIGTFATATPYTGGPLGGQIFSANCTGGPLGNTACLIGTNGSDCLVGTGAGEYLVGMGGDDYMCGAGGGDALYGEQLGGAPDGGDRICGNDGDDFLFGDGGDDYLDGNAGDDSLVGGGGDDTLDDALGTNRLNGSGGTDDCTGSPTSSFTSCETATPPNVFGMWYASEERSLCFRALHSIAPSSIELRVDGVVTPFRREARYDGLPDVLCTSAAPHQLVELFMGHGSAMNREAQVRGRDLQQTDALRVPQPRAAPVSRGLDVPLAARPERLDREPFASDKDGRAPTVETLRFAARTQGPVTLSLARAARLISEDPEALARDLADGRGRFLSDQGRPVNAYVSAGQLVVVLPAPVPGRAFTGARWVPAPESASPAEGLLMNQWTRVEAENRMLATVAELAHPEEPWFLGAFSRRSDPLAFARTADDAAVTFHGSAATHARAVSFFVNETEATLPAGPFVLEASATGGRAEWSLRTAERGDALFIERVVFTFAREALAQDQGALKSGIFETPTTIATGVHTVVCRDGSSTHYAPPGETMRLQGQCDAFTSPPRPATLRQTGTSVPAATHVLVHPLVTTERIDEDVEHLLIAGPNLIERATRYAETRTARGVRSQVISLEAISQRSRFSRSPRESLRAVVRDWAASASERRYVTLVGEGHIDDRAVFGEPSIGPATALRWDGERNVGVDGAIFARLDVAVGRLPFTRPESFDTLEARRASHFANPMHVFADRDDGEVSFAAQAATLLGDLEVDGEVAPLASLEAGSSLDAAVVGYLGHAGLDRLGKRSFIFAPEVASALAPGATLVLGSCNAGTLETPLIQGFAAQTFREGRPAFVFAAAGLSHDAADIAALSHVARQRLFAAGARAGDVIATLNETLRETSSADVFNLFGDPTWRFSDASAEPPVERAPETDPAPEFELSLVAAGAARPAHEWPQAAAGIAPAPPVEAPPVLERGAPVPSCRVGLTAGDPWKGLGLMLTLLVFWRRSRGRG